MHLKIFVRQKTLGLRWSRLKLEWDDLGIDLHFFDLTEMISIDRSFTIDLIGVTNPTRCSRDLRRSGHLPRFDDRKELGLRWSCCTQDLLWTRWSANRDHRSSKIDVIGVTNIARLWVIYVDRSIRLASIGGNPLNRDDLDGLKNYCERDNLLLLRLGHHFDTFICNLIFDQVRMIHLSHKYEDRRLRLASITENVITAIILFQTWVSLHKHFRSWFQLKANHNISTALNSNHFLLITCPPPTKYIWSTWTPRSPSDPSTFDNVFNARRRAVRLNRN